MLSLLIACNQTPANLSIGDRAPRPGTVVPPTGPLTGFDLVAVGYNVESGDAVADTIADNIEKVAGEVLWAFSEVESQAWLDTFAIAADDGGQDFQTVLGDTGNSDRLGLVYDANALQLIASDNLDAINVGNGRAPLMAEFEVVESGARFLFLNNHLWRTDHAARLTQSQRLNAWVGDQSLPVIAMGDYNYDWAVVGGEDDHDPGYDAMVAGGAWEWVVPDELIATQCSNVNESVLDFAFVGNEARDWPAVSEILFPRNVTCQDDEFKPDHRPVQLDILVPDPA